MKKLLAIFTTLIFLSGCATTELILSYKGEKSEKYQFIQGMNDHIYGMSYSITKDVKAGKDPDLYVLNQCLKALEIDPGYKEAVNFMKFHLKRMVDHTELAIWNNINITAMTLTNQANLYKYDNIPAFYKYMIKYKAGLVDINKKLEELAVIDPETNELFQLSIDVDYDQKLAETNEKCAESHYVVAVRNSDKLLRKNRFKAIGDFEKALEFVPGYKDAEALLAKVKETTMLKFVFGGVANSESEYSSLTVDALFKQMKGSFPGYFDVKLNADGIGQSLGYQDYLTTNELDIMAVVDNISGDYKVLRPLKLSDSFYIWKDLKSGKDLTAAEAASYAKRTYRKLVADLEQLHKKELEAAKEYCVDQANQNGSMYNSFDQLSSQQQMYYRRKYLDLVENMAKSIVKTQYLSARYAGSLETTYLTAKLRTDVNVTLAYFDNKSRFKQKSKKVDINTKDEYTYAKVTNGAWSNLASSINDAYDFFNDVEDKYSQMKRNLDNPEHSDADPQLKDKSQMAADQSAEIIAESSKKVEELIKLYFSF